MRTTLSLADDIYLVAQQRAAREHISLGEAVSRLCRAGFTALNQAPVNPAPLKNAFSLLPARDELISSQHIYDLMEQEGI